MIITVDDVHDELIYPVLQKDTSGKYMSDLEEYAEDFVRSVAGASLSEIVDPAPYKLKELCKCKLCYFVCLDKSYAASTATRGADATDYWAKKLEHYANAVKTLEPLITSDMLLGKSSKTSSLLGSVSLMRG